MPLTFQVENLETFKRDSVLLLPQHYEELALDKDRIKLGLQFSHYEKLESGNLLHIVTARDDGTLVGYFLSIIHIHPHYELAGLMAASDMFYVHPNYRRGTIAKLFLFVQQEMKKRGVVKLYWSCKCHLSQRQLFECLGFRQSDEVYTCLV